MIRSIDILRYRDGVGVEIADEVVAEEPLEIRVRGRSVAVTMRSPQSDAHDAELAAGFLLSEGLVRSRADVLRIDPCLRASDGNIVNVFLAPHVDVDFDKLTRHVYASSSCGLCGAASIEAACHHFPPISHDCSVLRDALLAMPAKLRAAQHAFERTGGLHAAGLFDLQGDLLVAREDVGRHNAVDKVLGHMLFNDKLPLDECVLVVSGRASFEIVQKALAARVPVVAAVSAPSSLAVSLAHESNQALVGFLRDGQMNVYAGLARIAAGQVLTRSSRNSATGR